MAVKMPENQTAKFGLFVALALVTAVVLAWVLASLTVALRGGAAPAPSPREPVPVLFDLPAFELTSQAGEAVGLEELRGRVWVANFIFTRCASVCPMVTGRTAELQGLLRSHERWEDIRLVSFTVDPQHDTPEVLREYGRRFEADFSHWLFLTGEREQMWRLVEEGFRLPVEDAPQNPAMPIMHSDRFVLVDQAGRIRGYYDVMNDRVEARQLLLDIHAVLGE